MTDDTQADREFLNDFGREALPGAAEKPNDPRVGFFPDMSIEDYFADPIEEGSLSNSGIKILDGETALDFAFQHPRINPEAIEKARKSAAVLRGDIVHQLALGKGRGYEVGDYPDFKTKAAQEWRKGVEAEGKTAVLLKVYEPAVVMAEVVRERIEEALDGAPYITEVPIVWREDTPAGSIYMRGMLDVWCESKAIILDPKVTAQLHDDKPGQFTISKHAASMGWDRQAALYTRGVEMIRPELANRVRFGNLLIKPEEPFTSRLLWPDQTMIMTALYECRAPMVKFAKCMRDGVWPSYPPEGEAFSLSPWEENRRLDAMEIVAHD